MIWIGKEEKAKEANRTRERYHCCCYCIYEMDWVDDGWDHYYVHLHYVSFKLSTHLDKALLMGIIACSVP